MELPQSRAINVYLFVQTNFEVVLMYDYWNRTSL